MSQRTVVLDLASNHQLARDLVAGGVFVREVLALGEDCTVVLRSEATAIELHATVVYVDHARGSGLQLVGCNADMKQQIVALASGVQLADATPTHDVGVNGVDGVDGVESIDDDAITAGFQQVDNSYDSDDDERAAAEALARELEESDEFPANDDESSHAGHAGEDSADDDDGDAERKAALNINERLRGLTLVQQLKVAAKGEISERVLLERMYGKNVWEALLRNPRITGPEVARIARMGALPRPLIEIIVGNGAWLQIPEVRRALLSNPRLGTDQILRVLRLVPKHELKLAAMQTAYPFAVRDAAKRMLRELGGER
jgi:hypothetical protein